MHLQLNLRRKSALSEFGEGQDDPNYVITAETFDSREIAEAIWTNQETKDAMEGGGGWGAYSMPARTGKTHHTRMSRSPGQQCLYARYMIWICRGGESPTAGVAIARDDGVIMG